MAANYFYGLGRRKSATARVRLSKGNGNLTVNGKDVDNYISGSKYLHHDLIKPFAALDLESKNYNLNVLTSGGGKHSQIEAIRLGLAKAITEMNEDSKSTLRRAKLLGRDPRERERKKFGLKSARKQRQFTKR